MKRRVVILLGVILVAAVAATAGHALFLVPCSGFWVCPDTPQLVAIEDRELMSLLTEIFNRNKAVPQESLHNTRSPEPLQVRVSQKKATLTTRGPMSEISLEYAAAWYDVYNRHHPGVNTVVYLHVVWPTGSLDEYYPITTLRATPPRDVRERLATRD